VAQLACLKLSNDQRLIDELDDRIQSAWPAYHHMGINQDGVL
jgi:hypothetical protein